MSGPSTQSQNWPSFPKAILSVSRKEHYHQPLGLTILSRNDEGLRDDAVDPSSTAFLNPQYWQSHSPQSDKPGPLPTTLNGHVFVIGTAASFDSPKIPGTDICLPTQDGWQHIYSGDGMIYRLDFHTSVHPTATPDNPYPEQPCTTTHNQGWANLATRLIKTPDYYADWALESNPKYQEKWSDYKQLTFRDAALTRLSMGLGGRNYLNTAWLPLKPRQNNSERLLVTWDAGRPYEVDPCSLGLVAPVGLNKDWKPIFDMPGVSRPFQKLLGFPILSQVFPMILSSAHPVYDEHEDAVYMVNGTKSMGSMMQISRLQPYFLKGILKFINKLEGEEPNAPRTSFFDYVVLALVNVVLWLTGLLMAILSFWEVGGTDRLFLYRWQGDQTEIDESDKWEVVTEKGRSIPIYQSVHQMSLTRDYIVISDSSFKFVVADVLPSLFNPQDFAKNLRKVVKLVARPKNKATEKSESPSTSFDSHGKSPDEMKKEIKKDLRKDFQDLFSFLNYAQTPYTDVYVIARADLQTGHAADSSLGSCKVKAKHFRLQPETAHFLASYDNPENKVVLHVGHIKGLDPAEFVNKIDDAVCHYSPTSHSGHPCPKDINQILQQRSGVLANSMAPNLVGTWTLDMETGQFEKVLLEDEDKFQLLAFFALNEKTANQVTDVYWNCGGAWPYHHTINHLDLYKEQIDSKTLDQQINRIAKEGRPANLLRVSQISSLEGQATSSPELKVEDYYAFPPGCYASSPQFVPREDGTPSSTHGYIVCVVIATDHLQTDQKTKSKLSELWIFDAAHLGQGPLYRLNHPELNIGPTLHTAWLSKLESPLPRGDYDVREDYKTVLNQVEPAELKERIHYLFEQDVFPHIIHDCADASTKQTFKIRIFDASTVASPSIHRGVEQFAIVCGYHDPLVIREEQNALVKDVQYQDTDRLSSKQFIEIIKAGVVLYRGDQPHLHAQSDETTQTLHQCAEALAALLKIITSVDNVILLLGQLIIIQSHSPEGTAKTYVKLISNELKHMLVKTPELFDSSQAMVNFLFNRAELPDAIS